MMKIIKIIEINSNNIAKVSEIFKKIKKTTTKIILKKTEELDFLSQKIFKRELLKKENRYLILNKKIVFENFSEEEIINLIGMSFFIYLFQNLSIKIKHNNEFKQEQLKQHGLKNEFKKFEEYTLSKHIIQKIPFSYINFPLEKHYLRFVIYSRINDEESRAVLKQFLIKTKFSNKNISLIGHNKTCTIDKIGFGFKYQKNELIRKSIYISFLEEGDFKEYGKYLPNISKINLAELKNISFFCIDEFKDNSEEIKIYFNLTFKYEIKDKSLQKVLTNKECIVCKKYSKNTLIKTKYEFQLKLFSNKEKELLETQKIIDKNNKNTIFSIYFNDSQNIEKIISY